MAWAWVIWRVTHKVRPRNAAAASSRGTPQPRLGDAHGLVCPPSARAAAPSNEAPAASHNTRAGRLPSQAHSTSGVNSTHKLISTAAWLAGARATP